MPKLWDETIDAHRRAVREATLDATAALVAAHGLASVTMSQIAERTGIGRATLYKYFPDVEAILAAWHERQIDHHLEHLGRIAGQADQPGRRLEAVLAAYAQLQLGPRGRHEGELAAMLHRGEHVRRAEERLRGFLRGLLTAAADAGDIRDDVPIDELAAYCLHALSAASDLPSKAAVDRLVAITLTSLRPGAATVANGRAGSAPPA